MVFVSGNFFILHPGHIRFLKFASECGDHLVVGVKDTHPNVNYPTPEERCETLRSLDFVDEVHLIKDGLEVLLRKLRPNVVVKGKEYENSDNVESRIIADWHGTLIFASGESSYSASDLLTKHSSSDILWLRPQNYLRRHSLSLDQSRSVVSAFARLRVVVVGDLIVDEYVSCEALGMSREDPTVVVSPQKIDRFLGGAGIVAAHAANLGADTHFVSLTGNDECAEWSSDRLVSHRVKSILFSDSSRPTSLKKRYRVGNKTMLRVSHLRQHEVRFQIASEMRDAIESLLLSADLLIFADFNYGCLPQNLVSSLICSAKETKTLIAADSQSSSQIGNIARFQGVDLITPTEHEARMAIRDQQQSLTTLGTNLLSVSKVCRAFITLGAAGLMVFERQTSQEGFEPERLPALNPNPVDVAGAGDSLLVASSMALAAGADTYCAAYLGAVAAAIQTSRVGNSPLQRDEIFKALH